MHIIDIGDMKIDELAAGRLIDAIVAERAMGWKLMRWINHPEYAPQIIGDKDNVPPGGRIPDYSTDIAAAWQIVEKLLEKFFVSIQLFVSIQTSETRCQVEISERHNLNRYYGVAKTTPLAICRAALKSVGLE